MHLLLPQEIACIVIIAPWTLKVGRIECCIGTVAENAAQGHGRPGAGVHPGGFSAGLRKASII